jgi:hypothetical protein
MLGRFSRSVAVALVAASVSMPVFAFDACSTIAALSANGLITGATNGQVGATLASGETITMTTTLGTATGGTFRIVGDPAGAVTLAGPTSIPGTLRFNGVPLPPAAVGIGYFIDAATGGTVNLTASCAVQQVPTLSQNMLILLAGVLLLVGGTVIVARRRTR